MKEIKFRGKTPDGRIVFGDFIRLGEQVCIGNIFCNDEVLPASVAQLIGYDANGEEIYDGDSLEDFEGDIYTLSIGVIDDENDLQGDFLGDHFDRMKLLKE